MVSCWYLRRLKEPYSIVKSDYQSSILWYELPLTFLFVLDFNYWQFMIENLEETLEVPEGNGVSAEFIV